MRRHERVWYILCGSRVTDVTSRCDVAVWAGGVQAGDFSVMCYMTNWAHHRGGIGKFVPEDIEPNICTHIIYAFNALNADTLTIQMTEWNEAGR